MQDNILSLLKGQ